MLGHSVATEMNSFSTVFTLHDSHKTINSKKWQTHSFEETVYLEELDWCNTGGIL